jgi:hypothetical protein
MQEVGGLLQRVGAVGDDDARHLGPRQVVGHPLRQPLPGGVVHVLAVELRHLLGFEGPASAGTAASRSATLSCAGR